MPGLRYKDRTNERGDPAPIVTSLVEVTVRRLLILSLLAYPLFLWQAVKGPLSFIGRTHPGFFVTPWATVGPFGNSAGGDTPAYARLTAVDGVGVSRSRDVYAYVEKKSPGEFVRYELIDAGGLVNLALPARRFEASDAISLILAEAIPSSLAWLGAILVFFLGQRKMPTGTDTINLALAAATAYWLAAFVDFYFEGRFRWVFFGVWSLVTALVGAHAVWCTQEETPVRFTRLIIAMLVLVGAIQLAGHLLGTGRPRFYPFSDALAFVLGFSMYITAFVRHLLAMQRSQAGESGRLAAIQAFGFGMGVLPGLILTVIAYAWGAYYYVYFVPSAPVPALLSVAYCAYRRAGSGIPPAQP